jgi:CarD family transcriptional regulator
MRSRRSGVAGRRFALALKDMAKCGIIIAWSMVALRLTRDNPTTLNQLRSRLKASVPVGLRPQVCALQIRKRAKGAVHVAFEVGQKVVYPNHGVSIIEEISSARFDDCEQTFYHLRLLSNNSKVMVPEENLDLVGLRPLGERQDIDVLFDILEDGNIDTYKDWKGRYKQNLDKMKTGRLVEVAEVLKNLCLVSQKKSLSFREKKMYERAKYFIVSEVAHVNDVEEPKAEDVVEAALRKSLAKMSKLAIAKPVKPLSRDDDDFDFALDSEERAEALVG